MAIGLIGSTAFAANTESSDNAMKLTDQTQKASATKPFHLKKLNPITVLVGNDPSHSYKQNLHEAWYSKKILVPKDTIVALFNVEGPKGPVKLLMTQEQLQNIVSNGRLNKLVFGQYGEHTNGANTYGIIQGMSSSNTNKALDKSELCSGKHCFDLYLVK